MTLSPHGSGGERRSVKMPLRSALRNASRTPSPLPGPTVAIGPGSGSRAETGAGQKRQMEILGAGSTVQKDEGKARDKDEDGKNDHEDDRNEDTASVSSYETGHEMFPDDDTDNLPSLSRPLMVHGRDYAYLDASVKHVPPVPNGRATTAHAGSSESQYGATSEGSEATTTTSATTTTTESTKTISPEPRMQPEQMQPRRRKSVRVSLQPTFSPTPPAIDDDDDDGDGEGAYAPWGRGGRTGAGAGDRDEERGRRMSKVTDMWQDSSEEDVEYSRARSLLSRLGRDRDGGKKTRASGSAMR